MLRISAAILVYSVAANGQTCDPPARMAPRGTTIFSEAQDVWLGEAAAAMSERSLRVFRRPGLTGYLDEIAARLSRHLPANEFRFTFSLIELNEANAFVFPGGRTYVSRKLVAFVENEDELAGVIAHEMGHTLARHASVDLTKRLKDVLNVTAVGDRDDVFDKYSQLIENERRKFRWPQRRNDGEVEADRLALNAVMRAGYDPEALARFLDRLTENRGATGNAFTDFFGLTRPESKRIRELAKALAAAPAGCREPRDAGDAGRFREWQKQIAGLSSDDRFGGAGEWKPVSKLKPALRPEVTDVRFTPDGAYLLAQDESSIHVMRRQPLELLFRIPAREAGPMAVSGDSKKVVFRASGLRVEVWDLEKRSRDSVTDVMARGCATGTPSPDGRYFACVSGLMRVRLQVLDVASGEAVGETTFSAERSRADENVTAYFRRISTNPLRLKFSPDGRYLVASPVGGATAGWPWAFDVEQRREISLHKDLRSALSGSFAFPAPDRVAVMNPGAIDQSGLFEWPGGKAVERFTIPNSFLDHVARGPYLLLRPFRDAAVAVMDYEKKTVFKVSRTRALDVFGEYSAGERSTGEIGVYGAKNELAGALVLPEGELGRIRGGAHSPDLAWLALSGTVRSGMWSLKTGEGALMVPFDGAAVVDGRYLYGEYEFSEKVENRGFEQKRRLLRVDLTERKSQLVEELPASRQFMAGRLRMAIEPGPPASIAVTDIVDRKPLWSSKLEADTGALFSEGGIVLESDVSSPAAKRWIDSKPEVKRRLGGMPTQRGVVLLRVLDAATGEPGGAVLIDTGNGSFRIVSARPAGRTLLVTDNRNRTLAWSLETGERVGNEFGRVRAVAGGGERVVLENVDGEIAVFDTADMGEVGRFQLPAAVAYAGFSGDARRLLAVTIQQEVYILALP